MKDCISCKHEYLSPMSDTCRECGIAMLNYEEAKPKPVSNYDRIRAMSDEELAEFFAQQEYRKPVFDGWLPLCYHVMGPRMCHQNGCEKCWLDWLRQEAI